MVKSMKNRSIVFTNENCIGCNKCINVCSAIGACISKEEDGKARIEVDGSKCVACGSCIDVCVHGARGFEDDTERFFTDLKNGERISLLLAPAFKANYPDEYENVLGGLKEMGVQRIISVSFGADITTWGYLNYFEKYDFAGGISQPCPALVSYIERYLPELLPRLFPVQSPLMCAAIYARKELGITDRFAFISPCIAKKLEIEDPHNEGLVQYNVTFEHLMSYIRTHGIKGSAVHSEIEYGLGSFYPTPGGLAENVKWFLGDEIFIRQVEGERHLYEWLHANKDRIRDRETPFLFIDALNCERGCICGTAVDSEKSRTDDALYALLKIREQSKKSARGDAWSRADSPAERLESFNRQFSNLRLEDYLRGYTDRSAECRYEIPSEEEFEKIFVSMNKLTDESRNINCTCCGYKGCRQMAIAIHNGFNHKENCIYYEKTMVHELEIEKSIAEEATKAKSSFLANMSHEIRTPINAVLGMNEMILRECEDQNIIAYSESIRSAGSTLLGLVNNILDFSKIEAGKMEIHPVDYDLSSVVNDLVNMVQARVDDKGLLLALEIDPHIPKRLCGDEIRVKQVITNMLTNAVKYTEKGTVTLRIGFTGEKDANHISLNVTVEDTGIGIKEEDISRLFEQFDRIEEQRNRNIEGTGLGMNITQRLLEMMDSGLEVESTYGVGSKFSFSLTQRVIKWEELGDYVSSYQRLLGERKAYREKFTAPEADVLVIDDNPMNLMVFKSLLKQTKVKVDTANSGDEGLACSMEKKYDIIFFDHMMPGKDGIETLHEMKQQIKNLNLNTPTVCLTANAISGAREYYIEAGFDDYLTKPIDSAKLEDMLIAYLPEEKVVCSGESADTSEDEIRDEQLDKELAILNQCDSIDVKKGISNSGSLDAYLPLLKIFHESADDKIKEIEEYYTENDIKDYTIKVHAMKSSARLIGAMELGEEAQLLENAGKSEDIGYIKEHHSAFIEHIRSLQPVLAQFLEEKKKEEAKIKAEKNGNKEVTVLEFQHSVFIKGVDRKLKEMGYQVRIFDTQLVEETEKEESASLFILYLSADIIEDQEKMEMLRKVSGLINKRGQKAILIGEKKYHEEINGFIPVVKEFVWLDRPLNIKILEEAVEGVFSDGKGSTKKPRVLIVDDDPSYAKMVREWISEEYKVDIMTKGEQAITFLGNILDRDTIDLILLDHQMPVMDGPAVFKRLREDERMKTIPIVFLTGVTAEDQLAQIHNLHPEGVLRKNTTRTDILEDLKNILKR